MFALIALGTVIGLSGIDLVLPAVPDLPDILGGDAREAQYVLAAFAGGTGLGLLVFGELGARFRIGSLLIASLLSYALLSLAATFAGTLRELYVARFFQGVAAAGPAVFAPVMIKAMYDEY
ncbi:MAG: MFS transporter, partial [Pseudomonadota bacterium]